MRIVSQDGLISVPFEMTIIRAKGTFIKMSMVGYAGETVIAEYSTPVKAENAMRLLHDAFLMHGEYKAAILQQRYELLEHTERKEEAKRCGGIFQFPKEGEL